MLWRERVTPFAGGGRYWAIPWYIVACESGGDYDVANEAGSGARGAYQMMPGTYASYCRACDWSPRDQDVAAHRLWLAAGGSPWSCA